MEGAKGKTANAARVALPSAGRYVERMLVEATTETFDGLLGQAAHDLVVLYFCGPNCPNCEVFAKDAPELIGALPADVRVIKINAYEHTEVAQRYGLYGVPAFVLVRDGKRLGMMRQYYGREYWETVISEQRAATQ